jgi:hypothetical protein
MASKRVKKVSIVEPERHCIKPNGNKKAMLKNYYGVNTSELPQTHRGICPEDAPYLAFNNGLYCCQSKRPTPDEAYEYYSMLAQNIETHRPEKQHFQHWEKWSGKPQTAEQRADIDQVIENPRKRSYNRDMRWLKAQFSEKGMSGRTAQFANSRMDEIYYVTACEVLNKKHCSQRRDCLHDTKGCRKRTKADMQALQQAEKVAKQALQQAEKVAKQARLKAAKQARQQQERQMQQL